MTSQIVLLTATITPRTGQPSLAVVDPAERLNDYKNALTFYDGLLRGKVIDGIVFVENSGFDLTPLRESFPSPCIEWITTYDMDYPGTYHRGYGEFRLIDRAMADSALIAALPAAGVVWKVTGRYIVENMATVIRFAPKTFDVYCASTAQWTELSLMAWTRHGHATLLREAWRQFATSKAPELILAPRLMTADPAQCLVVTELSWPPLLVGRRGTDGGQFTGRLARWKFTASLLPRLWRLRFQSATRRR